MQTLGWGYLLFPGLFGALVLMAFAAATDELVRAVQRAARCALRAAPAACGVALTRHGAGWRRAQKRRFVFELSDVAAALRLGGGAAAVPRAAAA
jgi:hypothetical protein